MAFSPSGNGGGGGLGPMSGVIMVIIGLVVVVAIMQFAPTIGGSIYAATPSLGPTNEWNESYRAAYNLTPIPSSSTFYTNNIQLISLLVTIIIISLILAYLIRI